MNNYKCTSIEKAIDAVDFNKYEYQRVKKISVKTCVILCINMAQRIFSTIEDYLISAAFTQNIDVAKSSFFERLYNTDPKVFLEILRNMLKIKSKGKIQRCKYLRNFRGRIYFIDTSDLEEPRNGQDKEEVSYKNSKSRLGGRILAIINAMYNQVKDIKYYEDPNLPDSTITREMCSMVEKGSLSIYDKGFYCHKTFDEYTDNKKYFIIPLKEKIVIKTEKEILNNEHVKDNIVTLGTERNTCRYKYRIITIISGEDTYSYITNVLDPLVLNPAEVFELYLSRWNIEKFFNELKSNLNLSRLWSHKKNVIEIQVYTTLIVYTFLKNLAIETASSLDVVEKEISFLRIVKSIYFWDESNSNLSLADFIIRYHKKLRILKKPKKRDIEKRAWIEKIRINIVLSLKTIGII